MKQWLDVRECAEYLGISVQTVYYYVNKRIIPFAKPKKTALLRFNVEDLNHWLESARHETQEEYFNKERAP